MASTSQSCPRCSMRLVPLSASTCPHVRSTPTLLSSGLARSRDRGWQFDALRVAIHSRRAALIRFLIQLCRETLAQRNPFLFPQTIYHRASVSEAVQAKAKVSKE